MALSSESLTAAWNALWKLDTPYDLRTAVQAGKRVGLIWFRPLEPVSFPRTGSIVILNREPWGIVSVDFVKNQVSQFYKMENAGFEYQAGQGTFSAKIRFSELKCAGDYVVKRGRATGSAIKEAVNVLSGPSLGALDVDDDPNITLAQSYQQQLINMSNGSGRFMIGTYYDYNDAYVQAFQNSAFANQWATYKTNGKTTQDFANQTSTAAQPGNVNTVPVNQDTDYNLHAFTMQNYLAILVHKQGNTNASNAVSSFYNNYAQPASSPPPTVQQVLTTVSTTPPPSSSPMAMLAIAPRKVEPWQKEILEKTQPIVDAIVKEEDDVQRGVLIREQTSRPIEGQYRSYFEAGPLTVSGSVREDAKGEITVECTDLSGPTPMVDVKLGAFPGTLHNELQTALEKADFLKAVLGKKVISALNGPAFLGYLSRMLTLAAGEKLGPVAR